MNFPQVLITGESFPESSSSSILNVRPALPLAFWYLVAFWSCLRLIQRTCPKMQKRKTPGGQLCSEVSFLLCPVAQGPSGSSSSPTQAAGHCWVVLCSESLSLSGLRMLCALRLTCHHPPGSPEFWGAGGTLSSEPPVWPRKPVLKEL